MQVAPAPAKTTKPKALAAESKKEKVIFFLLHFVNRPKKLISKSSGNKLR